MTTSPILKSHPKQGGNVQFGRKVFRAPEVIVRRTLAMPHDRGEHILNGIQNVTYIRAILHSRCSLTIHNSELRLGQGMARTIPDVQTPSRPT